MVATQGAPSAAGGWGAWGHIGRGLRSTLRPSSGREDNGPGSDGPDVSGTPGLGARGDARRRWGARRPVGRVGVTSTEPAGASGVDRTGETGVASRSDATARGVRRSGSPRSLPILSVSRAHARDVATLAGTAPALDVRPTEETRGETRKTALRLAAGVLSTVVVRTLLAPMERIKLEYQLNRSMLPVSAAFRKVMAAEGIRGFWRGNAINLLRVCPYKAINFAAFDAYRGVAVALSPGGPHDVDKALLAIAGAAAGVTSVCSCFPMDVVRTRLFVAGGMVKYGGLRNCVKRMFQKEGIGGFYRGFLPAIIAMTPNGAVYYTVYDRLKTRRLDALLAEREEKEIKAKTLRSKEGNKEIDARHGVPVRVEQGYMMLFGAMAGAAAEFSTYPFEVIRRRMQLQGGQGTMSQVVGRRALRRMTATVRIITKNHGLAGLYIGCLPSVAQVLPSAALGYYSYEMFKIWLDVGDE